MYQPPAFQCDGRSAIVEAVRRVAFGHLVSADAQQGLQATALPFIVDDEMTTVRAHVARANRHWRSMEGAEALLIVPGVDAYVSPRWYPSKAEDPKVVPTWNYELVHIRGTVRVIDDGEGKLDIVRALTEHHEAATAEADESTWAVSDAPDDFIDRQLRAIVGLELTVDMVESKRKLSQNRSEGDRRGVIDALARSAWPGAGVTSGAVAEAMDRTATVEPEA